MTPEQLRVWAQTACVETTTLTAWSLGCPVPPACARRIEAARAGKDASRTLTPRRAKRLEFVLSRGLKTSLGGRTETPSSELEDRGPSRRLPDSGVRDAGLSSHNPKRAR